jgi:hypothetical protein
MSTMWLRDYRDLDPNEPDQELRECEECGEYFNIADLIDGRCKTCLGS